MVSKPLPFYKSRYILPSRLSRMRMVGRDWNRGQDKLHGWEHDEALRALLTCVAIFRVSFQKLLSNMCSPVW
eukprot:SAG31_NODE_319_length_17776_cov_4.703570_2_plen_72_part_00